MDIIIHTLSGIAIGTVVAAKMKSNKAILLGGLGGAFPDIDALSLWSGFDSKIGSKLGLAHSGHDIYFGKYWYSHHASMHSVFAAFMIALIVYSSATILKSNQAKSYALAIFLGFTLHLFEDMPTPGSVWDGVNLFWPYSKYYGGSGDIWWWNNYDLFLIIFAVVILNLILIISSSLTKIAFFSKATLYVFIIGICFGFYQIKTRNYDFDYKGFSADFQVKEEQSLAIQEKILGKRLFQFMVSLDNKIDLNF
jgi:inner membrane protein